MGARGGKAHQAHAVRHKRDDSRCFGEKLVYPAFKTHAQCHITTRNTRSRIVACKCLLDMGIEKTSGDGEPRHIFLYVYQRRGRSEPRGRTSLRCRVAPTAKAALELRSSSRTDYQLSNCTARVWQHSNCTAAFELQKTGAK